jgi:hypothetical protein
MIRFLAGVVVGATAMYFLDPVKGRSRRAVRSDRWRSRARIAERRAEQRARDAANRQAGERARARGAGQFHPVDDRSVELHLHQVLAELDVPTADVTVEAIEGLVRVRGQVASMSEHEQVITAIREARGVRDVESLLHLPGESAPNKEPARHVDRA